jgi:hypothetical protein
MFTHYDSLNSLINFWNSTQKNEFKVDKKVELYFHEENNLVIVARWIENSKLDELVKRFLSALKK